MHLTPIEEYGEKRNKILLSRGKNSEECIPGPRKTAGGLRMWVGRRGLREKYYWELIKNDR
jgi:hypothetical protein